MTHEKKRIKQSVIFPTGLYLANIIFNTLDKCGITHETFAKRIGRHSSTVETWMDGRHLPNLTTRKRICTYLYRVSFGNFNQDAFYSAYKKDKTIVARQRMKFKQEVKQYSIDNSLSYNDAFAVMAGKTSLGKQRELSHEEDLVLHRNRESYELEEKDTTPVATLPVVTTPIKTVAVDTPDDILEDAIYDALTVSLNFSQLSSSNKKVAKELVEMLKDASDEKGNVLRTVVSALASDTNKDLES